jgi:hypothetical protein
MLLLGRIVTLNVKRIRCNNSINETDFRNPELEINT